MRPRRNLFYNSLKVDNLYNVILSGGIVYDSKTLDTDTSNAVVDIPITAETSFIEFANYTYSNGGSQYEELSGAIFNVNTGSPYLYLYAGSSNLDLMTITLGTKTSNSIPLNLAGQNILAPSPVEVEYPVGLGINSTSSYYIVNSKTTTEGQTSLTFFDYYVDPLDFYNFDGGGSVSSPFSVGTFNTRVRFIYQNDVATTPWYFDFGGYNNDGSTLTFKLPQSVIKDPNGTPIESTLDDFFVEIGGDLINDNEPVVLQNFILGEATPGGTLTTLTSYSSN